MKDLLAQQFQRAPNEFLSSFNCSPTAMYGTCSDFGISVQIRSMWR